MASKARKVQAVRFSEEERAEIQAAATRENRRLTTFIRESVLALVRAMKEQP